MSSAQLVGDERRAKLPTLFSALTSARRGHSNEARPPASDFFLSPGTGCRNSRPKPPSAPRAITIDDYFRIRAVSDPQLSPDARFVTYTVQTALLKEDKNEERIWMVATAGGEALPLTAAGVSSSHARWSPDGSSIAFLSAHEAGKAQVWLLPRHGGEAERLKRLGRPTELVVYPGEYGEFKTASRIKDRLERYLAWCNHYVNGDPAPARPPESPAPASKPL